MPTLKLFTSSGRTVVPGAWMRQMDPSTSHIQADVAVFAATKAEAVAILMQGGLSDSSAEGVVKQLKLNRRGRTTPVQNLIDAGVIDPEQRAAYGWRESNANSRAVRLDDPSLPVVAHFRFRGGREADATGLPYGIYAEAAEQ